MEAIALMADIHANLPAAEAVIADIRRKHKPDRIVSLGDQVNLGPAPCDTLRLLRAEGVTCLHGNHEGYILSVMRGEPGYAGANFASLRFNADRLTPQEIAFEKELTFSGVTLCHAMPEDDRFPVHNPTLALPRLNAMAFQPGTHIVCGHGHNPMHYRLPNLTLDVVGSVGCMDDGVPGMALYAMLYLSPGRVTLEPCVARYDPSALKPLFIRFFIHVSGFAEAGCREARGRSQTWQADAMFDWHLPEQQRNFDFLVPFVLGAQAFLNATKGEAEAAREVSVARQARPP